MECFGFRANLNEMVPPNNFPMANAVSGCLALLTGTGINICTIGSAGDPQNRTGNRLDAKSRQPPAIHPNYLDRRTREVASPRSVATLDGYL